MAVFLYDWILDCHLFLFAKVRKSADAQSIVCLNANHSMHILMWFQWIKKLKHVQGDRFKRSHITVWANARCRSVDVDTHTRIRKNRTVNAMSTNFEIWLIPFRNKRRIHSLIRYIFKFNFRFEWMICVVLFWANFSIWLFYLPKFIATRV